jgi:hypothetical protein
LLHVFADGPDWNGDAAAARDLGRPGLDRPTSCRQRARGLLEKLVGRPNVSSLEPIIVEGDLLDQVAPSTPSRRST